MQILINLPKEKYEWIKKNNPHAKPDSIVGAVAHGTPVTEEIYTFEQVQELVKLNQQFAQEIENLKSEMGRE